jgi:hypothetical protein
MGIVKFGQTNLSIEQVPDGHVIVSESEFTSMKQSKDAYLTLRSKIPVGVDEDQIAPLIDKGLRYDNTANEAGGLKTKITELQGNLDKFSNMPKDFSPDKWNGYVKKESTEKRSAKLSELSQKVLSEVEKEIGVKFTVDERFIHPDVINGFDPFKDGAEKEWKDVLDKAHTAQQDFIKNQLESTITSQTKVGNQEPGARTLVQNSGDKPDMGKIAGFH